MTAEETIASLEAQLKQALERLTEATEQLRVAQARIEELEKLKTPPPAFVKAEKKKPQEEQKKARKKRDAKHNRARPRSTPTQIVEHRLLNCPECQMRLGGISLARSREIIDVPPPPPVEVTDHRIYKGWCPGGQQWYILSSGEIVELLHRMKAQMQPRSLRSKRRFARVPPSRPMKRGGEKMAAMATSGASQLPAFVIMSTITREREKWSST